MPGRASRRQDRPDPEYVAAPECAAGVECDVGPKYVTGPNS